MTDWFCPIQFPIPEGEKVEVRGTITNIVLRPKELRGESVEMRVRAWRPIPSYEPTQIPPGEENGEKQRDSYLSS